MSSPPPSSSSRPATQGPRPKHRYRLVAKLGEGGMADVFLAEQTGTGLRVAMKVLKQSLAGDPSIVERFFREAEATAKIEHPNIVDIVDVGRSQAGKVFFVMEHLDGRELGEVLSEHGRISWYRAKPILIQLARALGAAHETGVIHRDMKPDNVFLLDRDGNPDHVKVLDFGIAKIEGTAALTQAGMVFGTAGYMAPEQVLATNVTGRADIYALGCMAFEMLTGMLPFRDKSSMRLLNKHLREPAPSPRQAAPDADIPEAVETIILRALAKDPDARFEDMAALERAWEAVPRGQDPSTRAPSGAGGEHLIPTRVRSEDPSTDPAANQTRLHTGPGPAAPPGSGRVPPAPPRPGRGTQEMTRPPRLPPVELSPEQAAELAELDSSRADTLPSRADTLPPTPPTPERPSLTPSPTPSPTPTPGQHRAPPRPGGRADTPRRRAQGTALMARPALNKPAPPPTGGTGAPNLGSVGGVWVRPQTPPPEPRPSTEQPAKTSADPGGALDLSTRGRPSQPPESSPDPSALATLYMGLADTLASTPGSLPLDTVVKHLRVWLPEHPPQACRELVTGTWTATLTIPASERPHHYVAASRTLLSLSPIQRRRLALELFTLSNRRGTPPPPAQRFILGVTRDLGVAPSARLRAVACLFIALGRAGGELDTLSRRALSDRLQRWRREFEDSPEPSLASDRDPQVGLALAWARAEHDVLTSSEARRNAAYTAADEIAQFMSPERLHQLLADLWAIADADGHINAVERELVSEISRRFVTAKPN